MLRVLTGFVLLVILWASVIPAPPWVFAVLLTVAITLGCLEASRMMDALGLRTLRILALAVVWAVLGAVVLDPPRYAVALPLVLGIILVTMTAMARRESPAAMLKTAGGTLLPIVVGLLLSYPIALRNHPEVGRQLVVLLFLALIPGDTAAYYVGRKFGRHKLAPAVSPKKTWEGAAGGVVAGLCGVLLVRWLWFPELPLIHAAILGVLLASAGILGDLAESMVKRASGVKDSSGLLPGHGGVLDRMDSLLFSGPILYYYFQHFVTLR